MLWFDIADAEEGCRGPRAGMVLGKKAERMEKKREAERPHTGSDGGSRGHLGVWGQECPVGGSSVVMRVGKGEFSSGGLWEERCREELKQSERRSMADPTAGGCRHGVLYGL